MDFSAPSTRASGKTTVVRMRRVKNDRLAAAGYMWPLCSLDTSPGARARYDVRRAAGDWNATALRNLAGKRLGSLHHCLQNHTLYDEAQAFPNQNIQATTPEALTR